jgi:hypothetical protein
MISREKQALINAVVALCDRYPHWRLGQLILNVSGWADVDAWDVEDDQLLAAALAHLKQLPDLEAHISEILAHYENQTEGEQFAEIEAARAAEGVTMMAVPTELVPEVRALLARKQSV